MVTVEECVIEDAGTGNGTAPKFGIDIEGYGEGDVDYEEPINVSIRNNHFSGNVSSSVTNFNGYGISIEGNHSDNTISYGYGTQTVIKEIFSDGRKTRLPHLESGLPDSVCHKEKRAVMR